MTATQIKAQLVKIELERAEGPTADLKAVTLHSWQEAETTLRSWAKTAPTRSCDKCDMVIYFDNGDSFDIGFDLKKKHQHKANVTDFVRKELQFMTGDWTPSHMTKQEHQNYLKSVNAEVLADYRRCLDTWIIPE